MEETYKTSAGSLERRFSFATIHWPWHSLKQEIEKELEIAAEDDKSDGDLSLRCPIPDESVPTPFVSYLLDLKATLLSPRAAAVE